MGEDTKSMHFYHCAGINKKYSFAGADGREHTHCGYGREQDEEKNPAQGYYALYCTSCSACKTQPFFLFSIFSLASIKKMLDPYEADRRQQLNVQSLCSKRLVAGYLLGRNAAEAASRN